MRRTDVDGEHGVEVGVGQIRGERRRLDARVVDEDVEVPESGFGFCREGSELFVAAAEGGVDGFADAAGPLPRSSSSAPWPR
ncbi:hypothetical protein ABIE52_000074 [Rhodococcus sp. OAS809]|uniref:hypothetical protein n=1 Tax=Rhodococcus sp. OAS809 TaxID=2663874 RepID=UPI0019E04CCD